MKFFVIFFCKGHIIFFFPSIFENITIAVNDVIETCRTVLAQINYSSISKELLELENQIASNASRSDAHPIIKKIQDAFKDRAIDLYCELYDEIIVLYNKAQNIGDKRKLIGKLAEKSPDFGFVATGIGSVPFLDVEAACREIIRLFPHMPFWPQFVKRSYLEDMSVQYSEGLPLLEVNLDKRSLTITHSGDRESELVNFYERFFSGDHEGGPFRQPGRLRLYPV